MGFIQEQQDALHRRLEGREGKRDDGQEVDTSLPDDGPQPPEGYENQSAPEQS